MAKKLNTPNIETTNPVDVAPATIEQPTAGVSVAPASQPTADQVRKAFRKFAEAGDNDANAYGIKNNRGEVVTTAYLRRYIQCWCRTGDGFLKNRAENFAYFMTEAFLSQHVGKTASQVGKAASVDARWGLPPKAPAVAKAPAGTKVATPDATPIAVEMPASVGVQ